MLEWSKNHPQVLAPSALSSTQLKFLNQRLGIWAWGFSGQLRQRLMQHLEYLELDDGYLRDSEILKSLSEEDLRWALEDRGM